MNQSAINDLLAQSLNSWYSEVSQWMPDSSERFTVCEASHRELNIVIQTEAWPHDLVDSLAALVNRVVRQVTESLLEDPGNDLVITASAARSTVMGVLLRHGGDIRDVLEQCIRYRLEAFELFELELAELSNL